MANVQGNTLDRLVCEEVLSYTDKNSNISNMLEKAKERIMESKSDKVTEAELLEQEIIKRKKEVKNLITAIAKSGNEEFIKQVEEEITKLNEERAALGRERGNLGEEQCGMQGNNQQLEFLMEQLSSFKALFHTLTVIEKREYLRIILDKVVWDGEEAHIFIYGSH